MYLIKHNGVLKNKKVWKKNRKLKKIRSKQPSPLPVFPFLYPFESFGGKKKDMPKRLYI